MGCGSRSMYGMSRSVTYDRQPYEAHRKHRELYGMSYECDQGHQLCRPCAYRWQHRCSSGWVYTEQGSWNSVSELFERKLPSGWYGNPVICANPDMGRGSSGMYGMSRSFTYYGQPCQTYRHNEQLYGMSRTERT